MLHEGDDDDGGKKKRLFYSSGSFSYSITGTRHLPAADGVVQAAQQDKL